MRILQPKKENTRTDIRNVGGRVRTLTEVSPGKGALKENQELLLSKDFTFSLWRKTHAYSPGEGWECDPPNVKLSDPQHKKASVCDRVAIFSK